MTTRIKMYNDNNLHARQAALSRLSTPQNLAPSTVAYSTKGHLLIMGAEDKVRLAASRLAAMSSITLLVTEPMASPDQSDAALAHLLDETSRYVPFYNRIKSIKGFLGQFRVDVEAISDTDGAVTVGLSQLAHGLNQFDIILDVNSSPIMTQDLLPAGYFHVSDNPEKLDTIISELPNYIGDFEKPRYFQINNDICAHSARGQTGCTRCLDICPADAISSIKQLITIDPYLCHGAGGCTSACPTGAITYTQPQPKQLLHYIENLLNLYTKEGGQHPCLLLHDHETGRVLLDQYFETLDSNIIPVQVEELAAAGSELWLASLALGANAVYLLDSGDLPPSMLSLIKDQLSTTHLVLEGLQTNPNRLKLINETDFSKPFSANFEQYNAADSLSPVVISSNKRETYFSAVDSLINQQPAPLDASISLKSGAPFGSVDVDDQGCTLCLSCVAVCPTSALSAGKDSPALRFTEQDCVQCGLCERSCPEKVISLTPRLLLKDRQHTRELVAEDAFQCISCGTPFAPKRTIDKMIVQLSEHRHFQGDAINRLKMCGDCRVRDIYSDLSLNPEKQLEL